MNKLVLFFLLTSAVHSFGQNNLPFNSSSDEMNPVLSPNGREIYFTRAHHADNVGGMKDKGDIWKSELKEGVWLEPINVFSLNSSQYNGIIGFDGPDKVFLYHHYTRDGQPSKSQGISQSISKGQEWAKPTKVPVQYFYNKSKLISSSLSTGKDIMVWSLESYKSVGAEDLYVSFIQSNEQWSEPKNLGEVINTKYQEMTPWLSEDTRKLYFASNGHSGLGSRDIFVSARLDDTWVNWSVPINLGPQINTDGVELGFRLIENGTKGLFTTTQNSNGYGDVRIREFTEAATATTPTPLIISLADTVKPANLKIEVPDIQEVEVDTLLARDFFVKVRGRTMDELSESSISATISIENRTGYSEILTTSISGRFEIVIPSANVYSVVVKAEGYISIQEEMQINTTELEIIPKNFLLTRIDIGTTVALKNVLFKRSTTELLSTSFTELDLVVEMLQENPEMRIEVGGHTDNVGNYRANEGLSRERAESVAKYLVDQGIMASRIKSVGYGGSKPIASNTKEETRRLNRRVEFTILEN